MKDPTREELFGIVDELRKALDDIELGPEVDGRPDRLPNLDHLLMLCRAARRDGYRRYSMGGGSPQTVRDDEGHAMPPVSDPVGELAADDMKVVDPVRANTEQVLRYLSYMLGNARQARAHLIEAFKDDAVATGLVACSAHAAADMFVEAERAGRCMWCYRFWLAEGVDPPVDILRARAAGRRIFDADIKEALKRPSQKRGKAKARR